MAFDSNSSLEPPVLRDFPEAFESERLHIRAPRFGDGAEVHAAILETWEGLHEWIPWARVHPSVEETEANVRQARADFMARKDLRLHLWHKESGELVGCTGFHRIDWRVPCLEIGYWCRKKFQGQGLIRESTAALTAFAFHHLDAQRLEIRCDPENVSSLKIPEALGYEKEGLMKCQARDPQGRLRDTLIYAKTLTP